jgi:glucokinase
MSELIVGVDVGGTKVSVATLRDGHFGDPQLRPTDLSGGEQLIAQIVAQVQEVAAGAPIQAVGIGVPSVVEFATGRAFARASTSRSSDVPLRAVLSEKLGLPGVRRQRRDRRGARRGPRRARRARRRAAS